MVKESGSDVIYLVNIVNYITPPPTASPPQGTHEGSTQFSSDY